MLFQASRYDRRVEANPHLSIRKFNTVQSRFVMTSLCAWLSWVQGLEDQPNNYSKQADSQRRN